MSRILVKIGIGKMGKKGFEPILQAGQHIELGSNSKLQVSDLFKLIPEGDC